MKVSFITTIYNEENTIEAFLSSLFSQTQLPDEIIIVDGGSSDATVPKIKKLQSKNYKGKFIVVIKKGNRSVGRNEAIKKATGDIIVCSDAGNILDKNWIKNIIKPFKDEKTDVVAGYYKDKAKSVFQKCLVPFAFVMPDKVDPNNFLPATRSIAFTKSIWGKVGGFDERFSHNEDYVFANRLQKIGAKIIFAKDAIVYWLPRNNIQEAFVMFFRFALGDAEAEIFRPKVLLVFTRYLLGLYFIFLCLLYKSIIGIFVAILLLLLYIFWSIQKNYKYVKEKKAIFILPLLQFTADASVLLGTLLGYFQVIKKYNYISYLKHNKFLFFIVFVYVSLLLVTLKWGIPNQQHPFPYQMDEWHQLQAVANSFRYGTPNTDGSANGTMFHFLLSGLYLIPFMLVKLIDPFSLQIDNSFMRERVFEVLRLQSIIFGVLSIFVLYKITGIINASKKIALTLFIFTPMWLVLSGYFKYDIALIFWILLSLLFFMRFAKDPSSKNFILAAISPSLAVAVKVSAIPLLPIYIFSFFWFYPAWKKNFLLLGAGVCVFFSSLFIFGFPDTLFGHGNIGFYLYDNLIHNPNRTPNFLLGMNPFVYLFVQHHPVVFGYSIVLLSVFSMLFYAFLFLKNGITKYKIEFFLLFSLALFVLSTLTIRLAAAGNRSLVLLPFVILLIALVHKRIVNISRWAKFVGLLIFFAIAVQMYQSFAWMYIKFTPSTQEQSSEWIKNKIPKGTTIGIENIPIYQYLPNIIEKEFYFKQYKVNSPSWYQYQIINSRSKKLPAIIVITNGGIEKKLFKDSPKKDLVKRLEKEGYRQIVTFGPHIEFYSIFGSESEYFISEIMKTPLTTTVYQQ